MKKEKVLLVNPNQMKPPVTPVALDYLAQSLEEKGGEVEVLDLAFSNNAESDIQSALRRINPLLIGITVRNLDDSYLASQDFCLERTRKIIDLIKSHSEAMLVLGGVGFSLAPEAVLDYCRVAWGICGEGEQALPTLVRLIAGKRDFRNIPGLVFREGMGFHRNPTRSFGLKNAALGRRTANDNLRYLREGGMVGFESKRGCSQGCTYCADPIAKGKQVRLRNPSLVAEELTNLYHKGIDHFHTCDSEFNLPESHAIEVCKQIVQKRLGEKIRWFAYLSPKPFSPELAYWMRKAGCVGIDFGVDHANDAMLETLGRSHKKEDILSVARRARAQGFSLLFDLLLGGPGETRETIAEAIELMKEASPDRVGISLGLRLYSGTRLFHKVQLQGFRNENPNLHGSVEENPELLRPIFYLESELGEDIEDYIDGQIGNDRRFLFGNRKRVDRNYNYNDNSILTKAIAQGYRGAFWDILRRVNL
jgi:tryptophan 2-C-methyltransferase